MINVGIIGLGFMAAAHIRAWRQIPGVRITALCNPSGRHLDGDFSGVAGNVGATDPVRLEPGAFRAYREPAALFADDELQVVDICAPTKAHRPLALAALAAGRHVVCEKPLTRTSAEAREIVAGVASAKTFFLPAMCIRFWPEWAWLRQAIVSGIYGRVLSARFRRVAEPPGWGQPNFFNGAESGGALFDLHIHDTDFVQYCFGRPQAVFSQGYVKFSGAVDHVVTQYRVAPGAIVSAEGGWAMARGFGFNMSYTVNFERATADYDSGRGTEALRLAVDGLPLTVVKVAGDSDGYVGELRHFAESIRAGRPPTVVTAADALAAVEICEAEEKSVQTGLVTAV